MGLTRKPGVARRPVGVFWVGALYCPAPTRHPRQIWENSAVSAYL